MHGVARSELSELELGPFEEARVTKVGKEHDTNTGYWSALVGRDRESWVRTGARRGVWLCAAEIDTFRFGPLREVVRVAGKLWESVNGFPLLVQALTSFPT